MALFIYPFVAIMVYSLQVESYPEQGKWSLYSTPHQNINGISKCLYKNSHINVAARCYSEASGYINIGIVLRKTPCWKEFVVAQEESKFLYSIYDNPTVSLISNPEKVASVKIQKSYYCSDCIELDSVNTEELLLDETGKSTAENEATTDSSSSSSDTSTLKRNQRSTGIGDGEYVRPVDLSHVSKEGKVHTRQPVAVIPADGIYLLIIYTSAVRNIDYNVTFDVEIAGDYGYLSAADWPLLRFYMCMCFIYICYALTWLIVCFSQWRDLLRVQYWIGAVIFLGMLEMAMFTAEYESLNMNGNSIPGLIVMAELVSCAKRTLARMLVIIVSLGFGIVRPRLGVVLPRVILVGLLYFMLASIEACTRALRTKTDPNKQAFIAVIALALLESAIVWWIFSGLTETMRKLRLRRNHVKYGLYRHFTLTLGLGVVASAVFMVWDIKYHTYQSCLSDWKELWVNDAVWHLLFALLLLAIMILWRPTINNQRFAFSPILDNTSDVSDEEEGEKLMADVSDTMTQRNKRSSTSSSPREDHSAEDDLKWIEENIPSSLVDSTLPVLDSDEEILNTKFEISKMQ